MKGGLVTNCFWWTISKYLLYIEFLISIERMCILLQNKMGDTKHVPTEIPYKKR